MSADSNGGRLFLNTGAQSGRGGGVGDGPPEYQFIRERRDNPKGPEKNKRLIKIEVCVLNGPGIPETERLLIKDQWRTNLKGKPLENLVVCSA